MRIIAGIAKGRNLYSIKNTQVRPTQDRVKEAVFNMLAFKVPGCNVLDLFSGFGGLGLEALSRGADRVTFVEKNYKNAEVIKKNIKTCGFEDSGTVVIDNVYNYLKIADEEYDLIFMDPPYNKGFVERTLQMIVKNNLLAREGYIISESHRDETVSELTQLNIIKNKKYGDTSINILCSKEAKQ